MFPSERLFAQMNVFRRCQDQSSAINVAPHQDKSDDRPSARSAPDRIAIGSAEWQGPSHAN
jgi:hypothetical protein